jgi:hypothetical protein
MIAKEKAAQLRYKYSTLLDLKTTDGLVLQCALISVYEILRLGKKLPLETLEYYLEVRKEIEKL